MCEGKGERAHLAHHRCHRGTELRIRKPSVRGIDSGGYLFARLTLGPLFSSDRAASSSSAGPARIYGRAASCGQKVISSRGPL